MSEKDFKNYFNVYEFDYKLPGTGNVVKFKPLTTQKMKKLLQYEDEEDIKVISKILDDLIEECIVSEGFEIDELYIRDRFSLLIEIRKKTKGESYQFQYNCPKCKSQLLKVIDLDSLPVKEKVNDVGIIDVADGVKIEIGHVKRKNEKEAYSNLKKNLKKKEKDVEYQLNILASSIKSIETPNGKDESLSFEDKKFIIDNTTQSVLDDMAKWFADNDFGIEFKFELGCRCGFSEERSIPMNQLFS